MFLTRITFYCCISAGILALDTVHAVATTKIPVSPINNLNSIIVDNFARISKSNIFVAQSTSRFSCLEEAREFYYRKTSANSDEAVSLAEQACGRGLSPSCLVEAQQYYYRNTSANSDQAARRAEEHCAREGENASNGSDFVVVVNNTNKRITYNMDGQDYLLDPNRQRTHRNGDFNISFDSSFADGYQSVNYQLRSGTTNHFRTTGNAIDLVYN